MPRRGNVVLVAVSLVVVLCIVAALAVDVGYVLVARNQLQNAADAAALAAADQLLDDRKLQGGGGLDDVLDEARAAADQYAGANLVLQSPPTLDLNYDNDADGDVQLGRLAEDGQLVLVGSGQHFNAVQVRAQRTQTRNGQVPLFFARILGFSGTDVVTTATAAFSDGVVGFRPNAETGHATLIPFSIHQDDWLALLAGSGLDDWSYDPDTRQVESGADDVRELTLFPGDEYAPGNFGALRIGPEGYGNSELETQIRQGVSPADLACYGGELRLDPDTLTLTLTGDTGLTTGHAEAAQEIIGKPVSMPIHNQIVGVGVNATYTIVGFAGVRIVAVNATGSDKQIRIQPAIVVDDAAVTGSGGVGGHIYRPVRLVH